MRRTSLRPNYLGSLTHFSPDAELQEHSYRGAASARDSHRGQTVDADRPQEACLARREADTVPMLTAGAFSMFCTSSALCATI